MGLIQNARQLKQGELKSLFLSCIALWLWMLPKSCIVERWQNEIWIVYLSIGAAWPASSIFCFYCRFAPSLFHKKWLNAAVFVVRVTYFCKDSPVLSLFRLLSCSSFAPRAHNQLLILVGDITSGFITRPSTNTAAHRPLDLQARYLHWSGWLLSQEHYTPEALDNIILSHTIFLFALFACSPVFLLNCIPA